MKQMNRAAGILMPLFSLPSQSGIGTLGQEAYDFVDFLKSSGQTYWQMLPVGAVSYGDSPYASPSAFAGNPYYIASDGFPHVELDEAIDYGYLYQTRLSCLKTQYLSFEADEEFMQFCAEHAAWLDDYCLFSVLKAQDPQKTWLDWDKPIRRRDESAIAACKAEYADEMQFYAYVQYEFFRQWFQLKAYANQNGIRIIGDIPIYTSFDSADVWANPELFELDESLCPTRVAGCPPDAFSPLGQRWGNPLYVWETHKKSGYAWWLNRIGHNLKLFDVIRIDHFRGLESYFAIPAADKDAKNGVWVKGPDKDFIRVVNGWFNHPPIIAEDLGFLTQEVFELLEFSGYPGMRVLQFGFCQPLGTSEHLPHNYPVHAVAYTGTHDNDTACGYYKSANSFERAAMRDYLGIYSGSQAGIGSARAVLQSPAALAIIPFADYLNAASNMRINIPSTPQNNWRTSFKKELFTSSLAQKIFRLTKLTGRER